MLFQTGKRLKRLKKLSCRVDQYLSDELDLKYRGGANSSQLKKKSKKVIARILLLVARTAWESTFKGIYYGWNGQACP